MSQPRARIDTHAHIIPPFYREEMERTGHGNPDGMPGIPQWSVEDHLELMNNMNITRSIISISSPGTSLVPGDAAQAASLTRKCNKYSADLKKKYPTRFGYWASLPLPFVKETLEEIPRALDEGADGFVVLSNHHGVYQGDSKFESVFEELNKRNAKVFIHPTTPCMTCISSYPPTEPGKVKVNSEGVIKATPLMDAYRSPMFEFLMDTARTVINLFLSDTIRRCQNITWIIPHAGGCLPPVLARFTGFSLIVASNFAKVSEEEVRKAFNEQFYFDLAGFVFPGQLWGLVKGCGIGPDRLLYGTDYCYTAAQGAIRLGKSNDEGMKKMFTEEETDMVYTRNAVKLLVMKEDEV